MTDFPDLTEHVDPALLDLLDIVRGGDLDETLPRAVALVRRAKALGWIRDGIAPNARALVMTPEGEAVHKRCRRA